MGGLGFTATRCKVDPKLFFFDPKESFVHVTRLNDILWHDVTHHIHCSCSSPPGAVYFVQGSDCFTHCLTSSANPRRSHISHHIGSPLYCRVGTRIPPGDAGWADRRGSGRRAEALMCGCIVPHFLCSPIAYRCPHLFMSPTNWKTDFCEDGQVRGRFNHDSQSI